MHILFLSDAVFEDIPGGSRVVARELAYGLVSRGHSITFLVARHHADSPSDQMINGVRIIRYDGAGLGAAYVSRGKQAARQLLAEVNFDIVHTHFAYAALGPLKAVPKDVPRVRTFHGPWDEEGFVDDTTNSRSIFAVLKATLKRALRRKIEGDNLRQSNAVLTLSRCFREKACSRYGLNSNTVQVIPGGADLHRFFPTEDKDGCRLMIGLPRDRRLLLTIRRLVPRMGLDRLIKAMPAVIADHSDVLLLIGGKGPEYSKLEKQIEQLRLKEHVRMIGYIPDDCLGGYYQASDLFILPTTALEGFGLVTVEALASGLPVIGTPAGATPEILGELDQRLIIGGTTSQELASSINAFLDGSWPATLTPARLHDFVRLHYNWEKHVADVEAVYLRLLS
jgi:glycosyltransferase involved in cell wall biosynthesis